MNSETRNKPSILVVEDENIVALDIEHGLKRLGYLVSGIVNNGKDAIKEATSTKPDLILMDIQIQGDMDGIEAADQIQKLLNIPVIFLTAYADEATLQKAKVVDPYGYLLKPFEETELHTAIEVVLQKHKTFRTKETLSKEALALSEERFKLFVDFNKEYALYMMDKEGNVISWNAGAERIEGFTSDEIIGKNFSIFYSEEDRQNGRPGHDLAIAISNGKFEEENWRYRKDGTKFWASTVITALKDKDGQLRGFGDVIRDLTSVKLNEENLQKAIIARDEFLSIASHELRTPISVLSLQLQMAQREPEFKTDGKHTSRLEKSLFIAMKQVKILENLINELLDISRIQAGKLEIHAVKTDLSKLVADVCHDFEDAFNSANIQLECDLQEKVEGNWDSFRLGQVVTNLLTNTLKYAPGKPVKIVVRSNEQMAILTVQDHGPGIPHELQSKIFQRFERASSPSISGLGLGLYIARKSVEAQGGTIEVDSEVGKGSVFKVTLPFNRQEEELL